MAFETYRPSGRMAPLALPFAAAAGLGAAGAGGWIYQFIVDEAPFVYLNVLATAAFGALIGAAVGYAGRRGKCRNLPVVVALAVAFGVGGTALTHRFAYDRIVGDVLSLVPADDKDADEARRILRQGLTLPVYVRMRVDAGWRVRRSGSGVPVSGFPVYLVWLAELGIVVGLGRFVARTMTDLPFCEELDRWMPGTIVGRVRGIDGETLRAAARNGDREGLLRPRASGHEIAEYRAYTCEDADYCYLSVGLEWKEQVGGTEEGKRESLVRLARFPRADLDRLRANLEELR
jgi:hypothetical protein